MFIIKLLLIVSSIFAANYTYTSDWFSNRIPLWKKHFSKFRNSKNINYLEVGVYEGRSAFWMLDNILIHPTSKLTLVDMFFDGESYVSNFNKNLKNHPRQKNIVVKKGNSNEVLKRLENKSFDIVYLDGSHLAKDVFIDLALSWKLLKNNGYLIVDNYKMITREIRSDEWPMEASPRLPVDAFISSFVNDIDVLHQGKFQVILKKKINPLPNSGFYATLVPTLFLGQHFNLLTGQYIAPDKTIINLSKQEQDFIKEKLKERKLGQAKLFISPSDRVNNNFNSICKKAKLNCNKISTF